MATNLREAVANAEVQGYLSQMDLKEGTTKDGKEMISGSLDIQTGEFNIVKVKVWVNRFTKAGTENKAYKSIQTVMDQYQSIAQVGKEEATLVRTGGCKVSPNAFYSQTGDLVESVQYQSNFFNRVDAEDFEPKAEFKIEMYIENMREEFDKDGEPTGRAIVTGWSPTYNGIGKIELLADENTAEAVMEEFSVGQTVEFYGDIINKKIEICREVPMKIGKPRIEKTVKYENALVITGASEAYEEEMAYDADSIQKAIVDRDTALEANKNKGSKPASNGFTAGGVGKAAPATGRTLPKF